MVDPIQKAADRTAAEMAQPDDDWRRRERMKPETGAHMHGVDVCAYCATGDLAIAERDALKVKLHEVEADAELIRGTLKNVAHERDRAIAERDKIKAIAEEWRQHAVADYLGHNNARDGLTQARATIERLEALVQKIHDLGPASAQGEWQTYHPTYPRRIAPDDETKGSR